MKLSKREAILVQALVVMGTLSLSALLVVNPTLLKITENKEKSLSADLTILDYESKIEIAASIGNNLDEIKKDAMKEATFAYDSMHNYRVDQIIQEFTKKSNLTISSISIGTDEGDVTTVPFVEYDKEVLKTTIEEGNYFSATRIVGVDLSVSASKDEVVKFIDDINNVDKSIYIKGFTISDGEKGTATVQLVFEQLEQVAFE